MNYKHRIKSLENKTKIGREFKPVVLFESDFPTREELQSKSEEMSAQGFKVYRVSFVDKV
ncbi:hypothetical protein [Atribacter laminatus]|uniref:Uncharacterized protein n=1 Tax=Atribacter laminatus TaxID=2847778 RepID=A0A7T1AKX4_ATRLM|nr:hypothetical protein [Atribacter laminatus]QPM67826.1 hypothetical protein RT761_01039 [Atribacter laminatus]